VTNPARLASSKEPAILVVDDDPVTRELLRASLVSEGFDVDVASNGQAALDHVALREYAVVLSDIEMSPVDGLALVSVLRDRGIRAVPVLMTGFGTLQGAVSAIHNGAFDYLSKPFKPGTLRQVVRRALGHWNSIQKKKSSHSTESLGDMPMLVGCSPNMVEVYRLLALASLNENNVLIRGESGTGKELVARAIFQYSSRKNAPFVAINCTALADTLLESELFGHVRGAFTGAIGNKQGLFDEAHKGTLFLDEIGDISLAMQAKLLRVLQNGEIKPVGSTETHKVDVRIIAATHRDLELKVMEGTFREDLYYRLKVLHISIPPLRERMEDLEALVRYFICKHTSGSSRLPTSLSPEAMQTLRNRRWPGNVRELENTIQHALAMTQSCLLFPEDFPQQALSAVIAESQREKEPNGIFLLDEMEKRHIEKVLKFAEFNKSRAADLLGIDRATLYRKAQKYALDLSPPSSSALEEDF
jgi:DNA-binding NtrC family response regulator